MKILLIILTIINTSLFAQDIKDTGAAANNVYLKKIDYRHRGTLSFNLPSALRLRFRPAYEYRYSIKDKKKIRVTKDKVKEQKGI